MAPLLSSFWAKVIDVTATLLVVFGIVTTPAATMPAEDISIGLNNNSVTNVEVQEPMEEIIQNNDTTRKEGEILSLPDINLQTPDGWQVYKTDTILRFTNNDEYSQSSEPEEQIEFYTEYTTVNREDLLTVHFKDPLTESISITGNVNGILQVIKKDPNTEQKRLFQFIFFEDDNELYTFSLFPYNTKNEHNLEILNDLSKNFLDHLISYKKSKRARLGLVGWNEKLYYSPNKEYIFRILFLLREEKCFFELVKNTGEKIPIHTVLNFDKIYCVFYEQPYSSFEGWIDNEKFIIADNQSKIITIFDVGHMTHQSIDTSGINQDRYRAVDTLLQHWVFSDRSGDQITILNKESQDLLAIPAVGKSSGKGVLYDSVNNGFLFIWSIHDEKNNTYYRLDFVALDKEPLTIKTILETEPEYVAGRGCNPNENLSSVSGEIILQPGCQMFPDKYRSEDGKIHVKLDDK